MKIHLAIAVSDVPASVEEYSRMLGRSPEFSTFTDRNGLAWETFSKQQQAEEIRAAWGEVTYEPK